MKELNIKPLLKKTKKMFVSISRILENYEY